MIPSGLLNLDQASIAVEDSRPRYRSGAVARMAGMPVSTLRIWEQRYRVTRMHSAAASQRLYSDRDVRRLTLMRRLTQAGLAIGTIASLDIEHLERMARRTIDSGAASAANVPSSTNAQLAMDTLSSAKTPSSPSPSVSRHAGPWRIALVGAALVKRLARTLASAQSSLVVDDRAINIAATFDDLPELHAKPHGQPVDLLLVTLPGLHDDLLPQLQAAARAAGAVRTGVLYGFGSTSAVTRLEAAGVALLREPRTDDALLAWLRKLYAAAEVSAPQNDPQALDWLMRTAVPPRRFDDSTLAEVAAIASRVACECPRHVAELLILLANFEVYSAGCADRSPADAQLHAYLRQVAGVSRLLHEEALARIASHEGIVLPS